MWSRHSSKLCQLSAFASHTENFKTDLKPQPLSVHLFHCRLSGSSVHSRVLTCVLVIHTHSDPFLTAIVAPAGTFQGLSWLLVSWPSPLPFHLLHAPHSPTFCRSSLLGFLLPFVLYLPHTLSHLLIPFFPALFSPPPHLQGVKDHSLKGIASTSNARIQMQKRLRWHEMASGQSLGLQR